MDEKQYEQNLLVAIGSGLLNLANRGYKTVSVTPEMIMAGDNEVTLEVAEILDYNHWYYDASLNSWVFELSILEE